MHTKKWIGWVIGTSLVSSGLITLPASAQQAPNQSDITGGNIFNNPAPIFENDGKLDPGIVNNARRLSQELGEASSRCCTASAPVGPRRFARSPGNSNQACNSPSCEQLNSLVQETKVFLDDVNRQVEQVTDNRNRTW
jgi:hypothetical protein